MVPAERVLEHDVGRFCVHSRQRSSASRVRHLAAVTARQARAGGDDVSSLAVEKTDGPWMYGNEAIDSPRKHGAECLPIEQGGVAC